MAYQVLVADDDDQSRRLVSECLEAEGFEVKRARDGEEAWAALDGADAPQIAVLDWCMPGMSGVDVCRRVRESSDGPYRYILLLSALHEVAYVTCGLSAGADAYLAKPVDYGELVERVRVGCRFIDRERATLRAQAELKAEQELRSVELAAMSTTDDLTGLNNRRGFMQLAEQHARVAARRGDGFSVAFFDLNGLKGINDRLGHDAGDRALREAAGVLKRTTRDADIVARLGGDEFVALLDGPPGAVDLVFARLQRELEGLRADTTRSYRLSISFGAAFFDPEQPQSVEELLALADQRMYERKRERRSSSGAIALELPPALVYSSSAPPASRLSSQPSPRSSPLPLSFGGQSPVLDHLVRAWSVHRPEGVQHAQRTMIYAERVARALALPSGEAAGLVQAAALHDIGELSVPAALFGKRRELTAEDQEMKRRHTAFGEQLLSAASESFRRLAVDVVRYHHERWDGKGYPASLGGTTCPRHARIVGVLDVYDHLRHQDDGEGWDDRRIAEYLRNERERRFDPEIVDCVIELLTELRNPPALTL